MSISKKNLTLGIAIGLVIGLAAGYSVSLSGTTSFEQRISELEGQVLDLKDAMDSKDTEISGLQSQVDQKITQISEFQVQIASLQDQIEGKNSEIGDLRSEITERDAVVEELQSQISDLEQQLELEVLGVFFSPKGGCENEVLYWISRANVSIHILIYSFTLDSIGDALLQAHSRGIEVQVVFEEDQISQYSEYQKLKDAGLTVRIDTNSRSMHNKVMVVDGIIVLTGSFNWSDNGENYNDENLVVIEGTYVATIYEGISSARYGM